MGPGAQNPFFYRVGGSRGSALNFVRINPLRYLFKSPTLTTPPKYLTNKKNRISKNMILNIILRLYINSLM